MAKTKIQLQQEVKKLKERNAYLFNEYKDSIDILERAVANNRELFSIAKNLKMKLSRK